MQEARIYLPGVDGEIVHEKLSLFDVGVRSATRIPIVSERAEDLPFYYVELAFSNSSYRLPSKLSPRGFAQPAIELVQQNGEGTFALAAFHHYDISNITHLGLFSRQNHKIRVYEGTQPFPFSRYTSNGSVVTTSLDNLDEVVAYTDSLTKHMYVAIMDKLC